MRRGTSTRFLCPWDSPSKNTGVGSHFLLQGIFPTQGLNPCFLSFLHCGQILYPQSHQGSPSTSSFSSVQSLSGVRPFATPWIAALQASLSITNSWSLLIFMFIESVMPSNHLIFCCPLLPPPSIFPSFRVFSNESALHIRWPKYWSFSFNISPSNKHPGLISFRVDWLDSQESSPTPQFKSINSSVLSFLYSPTLTTIHDHWKNHSFDGTDLC